MRIWTLLFITVLLGCESQDSWDCLQGQGDLVQVNFEVDDFTSIRVRDRVELILKQGPEQRVVIESGSSLLGDVSVLVEDGVLILTDANACNLFREYGNTKAYVTAPNIDNIRNESGVTVRSDGVLSYPDLRLVSEDFTENDRINTDGDFNLDLNVESLEILSNNLSNFFIRGTADYAFIRLFSGDSRVEAQDLIAQDIEIFHRGTNQIFVHPVLSIFGEIRSGGDVISSNQPAVIDVVEYYTGRLIFLD